MIELRGIIVFQDNGVEQVDLVVTGTKAAGIERVIMGVDLKINRGMILQFLSGHYGIPAGEIVWPDHIVVKEDQD